MRKVGSNSPRRCISEQKVSRFLNLFMWGSLMGFNSKSISLALLSFYSFLISINIYIVPPNYDLIKLEMHLTDFQVSIINGIFYLAIGVSALNWAYITDSLKLSRKKILMLTTTAASGLNYLASLSTDFYLLLLFYMLTGLLLGSSYSIVFAIISDNFSVQGRLAALAIWNLMQGLGASAGFALSFIIGGLYGWRTAFLIGSTAILLSVVLVGFIREPRRGESEHYVRKLYENGLDYDYRLTYSGLLKSFSKKTNRFLFLEYLSISIGWGAYSAWGLHYIRNIMQITKLEAGLILGIIGIGGALHVLVANYLQRFQKSRLSRKLMYASIFSIVEGTAYIVLFSVIPSVKLISDPSSLTSQIMVILNGLRENKLFLGVVILAAFGNMLGTTEKPINTTTISEVNLPEEKASILGYMLIFELLGKFIGSMLTGGISTLYGSLYMGLLASLSFYYVGSLAWILARKSYLKDREWMISQLRERYNRVAEKLTGIDDNG